MSLGVEGNGHGWRLGWLQAFEGFSDPFLDLFLGWWSCTLTGGSSCWFLGIGSYFIVPLSLFCHLSSFIWLSENLSLVIREEVCGCLVSSMVRDAHLPFRDGALGYPSSQNQSLSLESSRLEEPFFLPLVL
ncbi:hypothetical protein DY000_02023788 [Brassica cretica]|uniref:Uncharacterized protein n=1 Tax=Brassica cretica TaxID=69181 RepID=A0ABQ7E4Y2_BRACR|nr:hypothetical protein DY000_02023788 [Brassica cretica]